MVAQKTVVAGTVITLPDCQVWTVWGPGSKAGRYWATRWNPTRWLEVRHLLDPIPVTYAGVVVGHTYWTEAPLE